MQLKDKVAIVTGGSSGIGREIARRFAGEGAKVAIADVTQAPLEGGTPTADLIAQDGGQALFVKTDVALWDEVDHLVGEVVARWGQLDIIVNNAMIFQGTDLLDTTEEQWDRVMAVNLKGMFFGCKRAVQQMLTQEPRGEVRGRIVNITSQHGMICSPRHFSYGVSKAGGVYLTRQIAVDYAKDGIICNAVAPGKILTNTRTGTDTETALAYARARTPLPRLGKPEDVAGAALFLASEQATFMTGVNLMVDGGWMAG